MSRAVGKTLGALIGVSGLPGPEVEGLFAITANLLGHGCEDITANADIGTISKPSCESLPIEVFGRTISVPLVTESPMIAKRTANGLTESEMVFLETRCALIESQLQLEENSN